MNSQSLQNKVVLVTAGNQGGGAIVAKRFASAGAKIAVIAHRDAKRTMPLNEVSDDIVKHGGHAKTWELNLDNANEIKNTIDEIAAHFGGIDILINNFSIFNFKPSLETSDEEFKNVLNNIHATFFLSQSCIPYLRKSTNPHVINIAPPLDMDAAKAACQHHLLFSISKYGMSLCTLGMAEEFRDAKIAFNSLWQARPVVTQTLHRNFADAVVNGSNKAEIYAEAAYLMSLKPSNNFSGNFVIDEDFLKEAGMDVECYAVDPKAKPIRDIFLQGVDYDLFKKR